MRLSRRLLLAFLKDRANHRSVLIGAIYAGLITRVVSGQFDTEDGK